MDPEILMIFLIYKPFIGLLTYFFAPSIIIFKYASNLCSDVLCWCSEALSEALMDSEDYGASESLPEILEIN